MNSPSKLIGMLAFSYMETAVDSANISIISVTENQKQENCSIFICFDLSDGILAFISCNHLPCLPMEDLLVIVSKVFERLNSQR